MVQRKHSLKTLFVLLESNLFDTPLSLKDLTLEVYPQLKISKEYDFYKCEKCENVIPIKTGVDLFNKQRRCRELKRDGKDCYATRKNWIFQERKTVIEANDKKRLNTYESNLLGREIKELAEMNLISHNNRCVFINYKTLLNSLFQELNPTTLGTWSKEIKQLVQFHFSKIIKNKELCSRIFYFPLVIAKSEVEKLKVPKSLKEYFELVVNCLSLYPSKDKTFRGLLEKNFNLQQEELKELIMLQKYCNLSREKDKEGYLRICWNTWGTLDNDAYVPISFTKESKILKRKPKKIEND